MRCDIHSQLSMTYPFAIMMQLKSLEVTTTDILQLSLKKVKNLKNLEQNDDRD